MATQPQTDTRPERDETAEQKIEQLRELFADAPEVGKRALENVLQRLSSDASQAPPPPVESAGRVGSRLGKVSELTIIVPFAPGGAAARVPAAVRRQPRRGGRCGQRPRHALRVSGQRHEDAVRHRLRRRLGRLHRRLRHEDPRLPGHHRLRLRRLAGDPQSGSEGLPRQIPGHGRRLVRRQ
jgi:hypothetical protein